jgi:uncharacterized protein
MSGSPVMNQSARLEEHLKKVRRYWLVFLNTGPKRDQSEEQAATIQRGHLEHLMAQRALGNLAVAGPVLEERALRGICIYSMPERSGVETIVRQDPAIISGRLSYEIMEWAGIAGDALPENGRSLQR